VPSLFAALGNRRGQIKKPQRVDFSNIPLFGRGFLFFADCNWLVSVDTARNRSNISTIFGYLSAIAGGRNCYTYGAAFRTPYSESGLYFSVEGPSPSPVLIAALAGQGYAFNPVDLSVPNAAASVNGLFVLPLYDPSSSFSATEAQNIREIAAKVMVIAFGEWNSWADYDNALMEIIGHPEITFYQDYPSGIWQNNQSNPLGASMAETTYDNDATGSFQSSIGFTEDQIVTRVDDPVAGPPGMIYLQLS